ncbi:uncharacterized protein LOC120844358 [Ixodes scapularis]|uniref:uncharacterized protein LOC120844358 n=1 Tax=Ixodes scapularis TaxID=6945 RepID=UPI001C38BBA9|nr:uncharacterized protein LOC120844358 [Ixodes scapularis]
MELQRRVLLLTWAFFLTFVLVINAEASQCSEETTSLNKNEKVKELLKTLEDRYTFRKDTKSSEKTWLVGKPTTCLRMLWTTEANMSTASIFLTYTDERNRTTIHIVSVKSECENTLEFTFPNVTLKEFKDRRVKYKVLSTNSSCSILEKPKDSLGKCAYWVLKTGEGGRDANWCKPPRKPKCDVEIHTLQEPRRCKPKPKSIPPGVSTLKVQPHHKFKAHQLGKESLAFCFRLRVLCGVHNRSYCTRQFAVALTNGLHCFSTTCPSGCKQRLQSFRLCAGSLANSLKNSMAHNTVFNKVVRKLHNAKEIKHHSVFCSGQTCIDKHQV